MGKYLATNVGLYVGNSQNEVSPKNLSPRSTVDSQGWRLVPRFKGPAEGFRLYHAFTARRHFLKKNDHLQFWVGSEHNVILGDDGSHSRI